MSQLNKFFNVTSVKTILADASVAPSGYPSGNSEEAIESGGIASGYPEDIGRLVSVKADATSMTQYFFGKDKTYERFWVYKDPSTAFAAPDAMRNNSKWFGYNMWSDAWYPEDATNPGNNVQTPYTDGTALMGPANMAASSGNPLNCSCYSVPPSGRTSIFDKNQAFSAGMRFADYDNVFTNAYGANRMTFSLEDYAGNTHASFDISKSILDKLRLNDGTVNTDIDTTNFDGTNMWMRFDYDGTGQIDMYWSADGTAYTLGASSTGKNGQFFDMDFTHLGLYHRQDPDETPFYLTDFTFTGYSHLLGTWSPWKTGNTIPGESRHYNDGDFIDGTDAGYCNVMFINLGDYDAPNGFLVDIEYEITSLPHSQIYPYLNTSIFGGNPAGWNGSNYTDIGQAIYTVESSDVVGVDTIHTPKVDGDYIVWYDDTIHYPISDTSAWSPEVVNVRGHYFIDEKTDEYVFDYVMKVRHTGADLGDGTWGVVRGIYRDKAFGDTKIHSFTFQHYEDLALGTMKASIRIA